MLDYLMFLLILQVYSYYDDNTDDEKRAMLNLTHDVVVALVLFCGACMQDVRGKCPRG